MDARTAPGEERRGAQSGAGGERLVRVVAVGNRILIPATEAEFRAELERIVGLAAPHVASGRPTLVVLGELLGLPAALVGPRGLLARRARSSRAALMLLALAHAWRILAYRRRWPGISLVRALLLALTDALYRPFYETLSDQARRHGVYLVATTIAPQVYRSTDPRAIRRWGTPGADAVYLPAGAEVYNAALLFGPDGELLGRVNKVNLTPTERGTLDLTPGRPGDVRVISTAAGRLGIAISLDAFTPAYLRHLDAQGAEIVVQNDANDAPWAGPGSASDWQPQEWLDSVLGALQPQYRSLRYNVCAMQTGNFFDVVFDGQSSITTRESTGQERASIGDNERASTGRDRASTGRDRASTGRDRASTGRDRASTGRPYEFLHGFIGVDEYISTVTGQPLRGEFLACAPWVEQDPGIAQPGLTLAHRRRWLAAIGRELRPGRARANQYRESVVWADVPVKHDLTAGS